MNEKIREAYFKQKTVYNAYCSFDEEEDRFYIISPTFDPKHEKSENEKYELFKSGYKAAFAELEQKLEEAV